MNLSTYSDQSNTRSGFLPLLVATSLIGMESLLCKPTSTGLVPVTSAADDALYLVLEGADAGKFATVTPLCTEHNVRIRAKGAGSKGDVLVLATGGDLGKVSSFAAQTGVLFSPGLAEEDFVDGQLVLVRPLPRWLTVSGTPIAFSGATPANTASALTSYGYTQAQADALIITVREMRAALIAKGIMA